VRRKKEFITVVNICLVLSLSLLFLITACTTPAPPPSPTPSTTPTTSPAPTLASKPEPINLKVMTFVPKNNVTAAAIKEFFFDKLGPASDDQLVVDYVGGPEVIPGADQDEALKEGVVDIIFTPGGYHAGTIPDNTALKLSQITPLEERETGWYDLMVKRYEELMGVRFLGRALWPSRFLLYTNKKVTKLSDFEGIKFACSAADQRFVEALGGVAVIQPSGERYAALERGVVNGFCWGWRGIVEQSWNEVCKYVVYHPYLWTNTVMLMNLDTFNGLPKNLQQVVLDIQIQQEKDATPWGYAIGESEKQKMLDGGMEATYLSDPAEVKYFDDLSYKVVYDELIETAPEYAYQFIAMSRKEALKK